MWCFSTPAFLNSERYPLRVVQTLQHIWMYDLGYYFGFERYGENECVTITSAKRHLVFALNDWRMLWKCLCAITRSTITEDIYAIVRWPNVLRHSLRTRPCRTLYHCNGWTTLIVYVITSVSNIIPKLGSTNHQNHIYIIYIYIYIGFTSGYSSRSASRSPARRSSITFRAISLSGLSGGAAPPSTKYVLHIFTCL